LGPADADAYADAPSKDNGTLLPESGGGAMLPLFKLPLLLAPAFPYFCCKLTSDELEWKPSALYLE